MPSSMESGLLDMMSARVKANKFGLMVQCTKAGGKITRQTVKDA